MSNLPITPHSDPQLDDVQQWFLAHPDLHPRLHNLIRQSLDEVLDGSRTGRCSLDQLEKTEKTYIGTKVEIVLRTKFDLPHGHKLDLLVTEAEAEVDVKFTLGNQWMIPKEAVNEICLLIRIDEDDNSSTYSVGLLRTSPDNLNPGENQDKKASINAVGRSRMRWLARLEPLERNFLETLSLEDRQAIQAGPTGQARIRELFQRVHGRVIPRQAIETIARQKDPLKRVRGNGGARESLAPEGIIILGHQENHRAIARELNLPEPKIGEFVACQLPLPQAQEILSRLAIPKPAGVG